MANEFDDDVPEQEVLNLQEEVTITAVHLRRLVRAIVLAGEGLVALCRAIEAIPPATLKAMLREANAENN